MASWSTAESEWRRRVSFVSLIHYTGKNAIFLPVKKVLSNCIDDHRIHVQMAVSWVLREMGRVVRRLFPVLSSGGVPRKRTGLPDARKARPSSRCCCLWSEFG